MRWLRETPTFSNPWLALAVGLSVTLQLAVLYSPLNQYFGTIPLGLTDWALIGAALAVALPGYIGVVTAIRRYDPVRAVDGSSAE